MKVSWKITLKQGCESSDFNLISDFFASQNPIFRLLMHWKAHLSGISDYFRLFLRDALTPLIKLLWNLQVHKQITFGSKIKLLNHKKKFCHSEHIVTVCSILLCSNSNSALSSIFKANYFSNFIQFLQTICDAIRDYEPIVESLTQQADDLLAAQVNDPEVKPAATKLTNAYRELEKKAQVRSNDGDDDDNYVSECILDLARESILSA